MLNKQNNNVQNKNNYDFLFYVIIKQIILFIALIRINDILLNIFVKECFICVCGGYTITLLYCFLFNNL